MAAPAYTDSLHGLCTKSIDRANKSVHNLGSWEEARDHAKRRIKELQYALRVFKEKIKSDEPWPEGQSDAATHN